MSTHNVNLGLGRDSISGMFFHAPKGTALPATPADALAEAWVSVGDISEEGVTWTPIGSMTVIRNWAKEAVRNFSEEKGSASAPIIYTTEEALKAVFGADAVEVAAATTAHGKLVTLTPKAELIEPQAFLFIGKDDDDLFMLGTSSGTVNSVGDVAFAPNGTISWTPTIEGDWTFVKDDGQIVQGNG